jgi:hypothetical protein
VVIGQWESGLALLAPRATVAETAIVRHKKRKATSAPPSSCEELNEEARALPRPADLLFRMTMLD